jgi:D-3-phosphoglycerate dehydrogenase / 2-oxoglutarate reductase
MEYPTTLRAEGNTSARPAPLAVVLDAGYDDHGPEEAVLSPLGLQVVERPCHGDQKAVLRAVEGARAVLVRESPLTASAMDAMPDCHVIVRYGVGVDNIDLVAAAERGITVANVPDYGIEEVSDHALALLLAVERRIVPRDKAVRAGGWNIARAEPMRRLTMLTLGIIGHGRIGQAFHRKAAALGLARVLIHDPSDPGSCDLDDLLTGSDIVSLHVPLTPGTAALIGADRIARMRPGASLINTARGGLVDEGALAAAIASGRLRGAGLDVFAIEPPSSDNPLLALPQVVLSDHTGWYSEASIADLQRKAAEEVARVLRGESPRHWVNAPPAYPFDHTKQREK